MPEAPLPLPAAGSMADPHSQVTGFLTLLDEREREAFINFVKATESIYEIWLYARVVGYEGPFVALEAWVKAHYPKLDRRALLLGETIKLEGDIDMLRQQVEADLIKADNAASRIAQLSKELRGHISEIEKISKATDRRGLILSGADQAMRSLKAIFKGNEEVGHALDLACQSVWAELLEDA